jgi:hypothetical protein
MKSLKNTIKAYKDARQSRKQKHIAKLEANIDAMEKMLKDMPNVFGIAVGSLNVLAEKYYDYTVKKKELTVQLERMTDVMPKRLYDQVLVIIVEFFFGVWFLAFFTYRILGEESFSELVPTFGLNVDPLLFSMLIEGVTVVAVSFFFSMINRRGFSEAKHSWYGKWLVGVLIAWIIAFISFLILYNM